jgi:hypothetical protein
MSNELHWKQDLNQEAEDPNANFPAVPLPLLEELEKRYPDRCPRPDASDREIWMAVGRAQVVLFLREMSNRIPTFKEN